MARRKNPKSSKSRGSGQRPSKQKARKMLDDDQAKGKSLTDAQRELFSSIAYGGDNSKKKTGGSVKYDKGGKYHAIKASETSGDSPKYPINSAKDVKDAWSLRSHGDYNIPQSKLEQRIKRKAREYGVELSSDDEKSLGGPLMMSDQDILAGGGWANAMGAIGGAASSVSNSGAQSGQNNKRTQQDQEEAMEAQKDQRQEQNINTGVQAGMSAINPGLGALYGLSTGIASMAYEDGYTSGRQGEENTGERVGRTVVSRGLDPVGQGIQYRQDHGTVEGTGRSALETSTLGLVDPQDVFSGNPHTMFKFQKGGDLTHYNEGGRHNDPDGGVDLGNAEVEEGETREGDYIYSDRLKLNKSTAKEVGLPEDLAGQTFADASKDIEKKYAGEDARAANDPYTKKAMEREYERLKEANDMERERDEEKDVDRALDGLARQQRQLDPQGQGTQQVEQMRQAVDQGRQQGMKGQDALQQVMAQAGAGQQGQAPQQQMAGGGYKKKYQDGGNGDGVFYGENDPWMSTTERLRKEQNRLMREEEVNLPEREVQDLPETTSPDERGVSGDNRFFTDQTAGALNNADLIRGTASGMNYLRTAMQDRPTPIPEERYQMESELDYEPVDREATMNELRKSYRRGEESLREAAQTPGQYLSNRTQLASDEAMDRSLTELKMDLAERKLRRQTEQHRDQIERGNLRNLMQADRLNAQASSAFNTRQDQAFNAFMGDVSGFAQQGERREMTEDYADTAENRAVLNALMRMGRDQDQQQNNE